MSRHVASNGAFEAELASAYPPDAPERTDTREFDLRAAPAEVQQVDGRILNVWAYNVAHVVLGDRAFHHHERPTEVDLDFGRVV